MYRTAVQIWRSVSSVIPCIALCLLYPFGAAKLAAQTSPTTPAQSESDQRVEETTASPGQEEATLVIQNRMITVFRSRFFGRSPAVRVEGAQRQFREVITSRQVANVTARPIAQGVQVSIGEEGIFTLTPDDLDQAAEETMDEAAARAVNSLTVAYAETLELRDAKRMWEAVGLTVLATILLILSFWLLRRARRFAQTRLVSAASKRVGDMSIGGFTLLTRERLLSSTRWFVNFLMWAIELVLIYLWLVYSLKRFPYTRPWGEALGGYLLTTFQSLLLGAIAALPGLLVVVIILFVTRLLGRWVRAFFNAVERGKVSVRGIYPDTAPATRTIAVILIWLFALIAAYPYIPGSSTQAFKAVGVFLGLVISLSSSGLLAQAMSGFVLMYSRALKPGEYVTIKDVEGVVDSVGMFSTKIRTIKNEEVTIPNSVILATNTLNYSRLTADSGSLAYTTVTIGYSVPWRQVHAMLLLAAERTPGLRKEPPPFVLQNKFSDFYVEYQLNAALERTEERLPVLAQLRPNIQDVFNEHGVELVSPHYIACPPELVRQAKEQRSNKPSTQPEGQEKV
jgi:small-conductance mechanosensitive channel